MQTKDYNPNSRCAMQTAKTKMCKCAYCETQTATFQTEGPVRLYAALHILTCLIRIEVNDLDIRILTYTPVQVILSYTDTPLIGEIYGAMFY